MKICFISAFHPPDDKRVYGKEAISLAKAGFEVCHIAPGELSNSKVTGVRLITYIKPSGIWERIKQLPLLWKLAKRENADCYHCNEVDSWMVGLALKIVTKRKIVFDVHEIYPEYFAQSRFRLCTQAAVAFLMRFMFKICVPFTDRLVFAKESVAVDFRGSEHKQVLVRNYATLGALQCSDADEKRRSGEERYCGTISAIHLGGMSRERGWPQLLKAMSLMKDSSLELNLVGGFSRGEKDEFMESAKNLKLAHKIQMTEWVPFSEAFRRLQEADIGLVLFQPGHLNHVHALPHKLFDYMLACLPVIVPSFAVEVSRIVNEADCGILVDTSNVTEIKDALEYLVRNPEERLRLGGNGRQAVLRKYNWENEAQLLIGMYKEIEKELLNQMRYS
jgi:glycosyltransferase involved in cell wall biosynthesis